MSHAHEHTHIHTRTHTHTHKNSADRVCPPYTLTHALVSEGRVLSACVACKRVLLQVPLCVLHASHVCCMSFLYCISASVLNVGWLLASVLHAHRVCCWTYTQTHAHVHTHTHTHARTHARTDAHTQTTAPIGLLTQALCACV